MATYGIKIIQPNGTDFTETYKPVNLLYATTLTANGSFTATLLAGESLIVPLPAMYKFANASYYAVYVNGGTVSWTLNGSTTATGFKGIVWPSSMLLIMRRR